jgi:very-short-patch-repair endonuclease
MDAKGAKADLLIERIASRQYGVVSVGQLLEAGVSRNAVRRRVEAGRLHRLHRGVYAVGHLALSPEGHWMAAVLACRRSSPAERRCVGGDRGDEGAVPVAAATVLGYWGAALSHRSAACLWGLLGGEGGPVDVSVPGDGGKKKRRGIRVHRYLSLGAADVTLHRSVPVTTPARTISDLRRSVSGGGASGFVSPRELRRAARQADVLGLAIGPQDDRDRTRSDLERDFLRLCRRHRLPAPEVNVRIDRHLVDFLWRDRGLIVETDGYRYHRGKTAFQDDRRRDFELRTRGYEVIRLSERQVEVEPARIAEWLRARLTARAAPRADL